MDADSINDSFARMLEQAQRVVGARFPATRHRPSPTLILSALFAEMHQCGYDALLTGGERLTITIDTKGRSLKIRPRREKPNEPPPNPPASR